MNTASYRRASHKSNKIYRTPAPLRERLLDYLAVHGGEVYFDEAVMSDLQDDGWSRRRLKKALNELRGRGLIAVRNFVGVKVVQALVGEFQESL